MKLNFARITDFKGRSRRSELWWNYLVYTILTFCLSLLLGTNFIFIAIISFFLQLVIVPVTIRRMHDGGHSGIWVVAAVLLNVATNVYGFMKGFASIGDLSPEEVITIISNPAFIGLSLASLIVEIVIFIFAVMDGTKGENKYGASTKYIVETVEEAAE